MKMIELLFPLKAQLVIEDVEVQAEKIDIYARRCVVKLPCPDCQQISEKEHSHYQRHPYDLPCFGIKYKQTCYAGFAPIIDKTCSGV